MNVKKRIVAGLAVFVCFASQTTASQAVTASISAPEFTISINGVSVENSMREYPFVVYNDITYFPMTYQDSSFMGVQTDWNAESGLVITKAETGGPAQFSREELGVQTFAGSSAEVYRGPIVVNGIPIDNGAEPYPILSYQDIAYFPMTFRFAHDEFGWDYRFTEEQGLTIVTENYSSHSEAEQALIEEAASALAAAFYRDQFQISIRERILNVAHQMDNEYHVNTFATADQLPLFDTAATVTDKELGTLYSWKW